MTRILIVDDNVMIIDMLKRFLTKAKFDVITAFDGDECLEVYRKDKTIKLVITDILMPNKEGIETIMDLKDVNPNVKIIAISGGGIGESGDYLEIARSLNVDHTFSKPFEIPKLLDAVKKLIGEP